MGEQQFAPQIYVGLKGEFKAHVERNFGPQKTAAQFTTVGQQHLSDYGNRNSDTWPRADVILDLAKASNDVSVIAYMADQLGYAMWQRPLVSPATTDEAGLLKCAKETTEALSKGWADRADGKVTAAERREEIQQIDEAVVALLEHRARLAEDL